jgi:SM-20-related protein
MKTPTPRVIAPLTDREVAHLGDGGAVVRDGFLGDVDARACADLLAAWRDEGRLTPKGMGRERVVDVELRGDLTIWLSEAPPDPHLAVLWRAFEAVRRELNEAAWLGLQRFSVQLACFPGDGARYVRHKDAIAGRGLRRATAIVYLNSGWEPAHGGALRAFEPAGVVDVEPRLDRLVIFLADRLEHEVLPTWAPRYAATAWFEGPTAQPLIADPGR